MSRKKIECCLAAIGLTIALGVALFRCREGGVSSADLRQSLPPTASVCSNEVCAIAPSVAETQVAKTPVRRPFESIRNELDEDGQVALFDELTDKWTEAKDNGISVAEIDEFIAAFKALPSTRQDECIDRALNLLPDENTLLLIGVLMDKSIRPEILQNIFNRILNRDESIKRVVIDKIAMDKSHPCWDEAQWLLKAMEKTPPKK